MLLRTARIRLAASLSSSHSFILYRAVSSMPTTQQLDHLASIVAPLQSSEASSLIAAACSTSLSKGQEWLPAIYSRQMAALGIAAPADRTPAPINFAEDALPRRRFVRRLKETLTKLVILCGIPKVIESSLALERVTEVKRSAMFYI